MHVDRPYRRTLATLMAAALVWASPALACTRALYVAKDGTVIVGRSMDWGEDMSSNMWVLPRGMKRDGTRRQEHDLVGIEVRQPDRQRPTTSAPPRG